MEKSRLSDSQSKSCDHRNKKAGADWGFWRIAITGMSQQAGINLDRIKAEHNTKKTIIVWKLLKNYISIGQITLILVCLTLTSVITFIRPLIIKGITDEGMLQSNLQKIIIFSMLLLLTALIEQIADLVQSERFAEIQNRITQDLHCMVFEKMLHLPQKYFTEHNSAEILNNVSMDIRSVSMVADRRIIFFISYILSIVGGLLGLFLLNWKMTIAVIAVVPIKIVISMKMSDINEKTTDESINSICRFSSWFGDTISGIKEVKLWGLCDHKKEQLSELQSDSLQASKKQLLYSCLNNSSNCFLSHLVQSVLYIFGGALFMTGELTLGGVTAFIAYSGQVLGPITSLMSAKYTFSGILPSLKRLNRFLELEEQTNTISVPIKNRLSQPVFELKVQGLTFSHSKDRLLDDINFKISSGEKVAVIGPNGCGKSTLIDLLLRLEIPESGKIEINGNDAREYSDPDYWEMFAVVEQEPYFFKESVRNNVDPRRQYSDDHIKRIFEQCGVMDFIRERFKDDLNTEIHYDAGDLSGGEKKRLAVARAILKDAPILIMDEAAADYDFDTEMKLSQMISTQFDNKIIIYITHNYHYLDIFNAVYKLEDGRLNRLSQAEVAELRLMKTTNR